MDRRNFLGGGALAGLALPLAGIAGGVADAPAASPGRLLPVPLRRGDTVVTAGGMIAKVSKVVADGESEVEIAAGGRVRIVRGMIQDVRSKSEPVKN